MTLQDTRYSFGRNLSLPFDMAVRRITEELAKVGFGVLTDIDVQATMKAKLGLEMAPYRILGACNPGFASQAISAEPSIGALLPCNVVVRTLPDNEVRIEAMDPQAVMQLVDRSEVAALSVDVRRAVKQAIDAV
jgi:uncharacterized protein (DUF302 family)